MFQLKNLLRKVVVLGLLVASLVAVSADLTGRKAEAAIPCEVCRVTYGECVIGCYGTKYPLLCKAICQQRYLQCRRVCKETTTGASGT